jgi:hypothetical protein
MRSHGRERADQVASPALAAPPEIRPAEANPARGDERDARRS